jgi:DNA repair protein RecO (recombination protein O)
MAFIETESLVLKSYNLAEADKIVVLLTHDHGVVRGVAKGAKRLKSKFGSGLEPFSVVQSAYFQKDAVELVAIERIDLIRSSFAAASDPHFLEKFAYLADLLIAISPPHDPSETLYRMAKACLQTASDDPLSLLSVGVYFEIWLLRIGGYLPDWSRCGQCGRAFHESEEAGLGGNFHLYCLACRQGRSAVLTADLRGMASAVLRISPADFAVFAADRAEELAALSGISKRMISLAIGREVTSERAQYTRI